MSGKQTIQVGERQFMITGNEADGYFNDIANIAAQQTALFAWARAHLPPDAVVIDAGANIGLTTLVLASLLPQGHVHAFEAMPANAAFLRQNIENNGIANCTVNARALGAATGRLSMRGSGAASHVAASSEPAEGDIETTTIDLYAQAQNLPRLDFIKMDVEGYEPAVLDGARVTIQRFSPPIYMEFNAWCLSYLQGFNARDLAFALWQVFDAARLGQDGTETRLTDTIGFLHDNIVLHGAVDDLLLRFRPGVAIPRFDDRNATRINLPQLVGIYELRARIKAIENSTSWRITAPLRRLKQLLS